MFILPRATRPGPSAKEHLCRLGAGKEVVFGTEVDVGVMGVAVAALALLAKFASLGVTSTAACAYRGVSRPPPPADPGGVGASAGVCWCEVVSVVWFLVASFGSELADVVEDGRLLLCSTASVFIFALPRSTIGVLCCAVLYRVV